MWFEQVMQKKQECWKVLQECKSLSRLIKAQQHITPWNGESGRYLPSKELCDQFLTAYLRTFEKVHRIFHIPSLMQEYDQLWQAPKTITPLLTNRFQLCFAIGSCFHDDSFSHRQQAMQWVYEAETMLAFSPKYHTTIDGIQLQCLLIIARQLTKSMHGDVISSMVGSLLKAAMSQGLHHDPACLPKMPILQAEIRRRLWTTILELELSASFEAGSCPLISEDCYGCQLPGNYDDAQLIPGAISAQEQVLDKATDSTFQLVLGQSLCLRLRVVKILNHHVSVNRYEETLKLTKDLLAASREQSAKFESFGLKAASFGRRYVETITRRCLLALHIPFMPLSFINPSYSFSRQMAVETAIELAYSLTFPADNEKVPSNFSLPRNSLHKEDEDILRLYAWGSGPFRSLPWQCFFVIASELLAISHGAFGEIPLFAASNRSLRSYELRMLLQRGVQHMEKRLKFVGVNIKDFVFAAAFVADIESRDQMDEKSLEAFQHAASILRERAGGGSVSGYGSDQGTVKNAGSVDDFWIPDFSEDDWNSNLHMSNVYVP